MGIVTKVRSMFRVLGVLLVLFVAAGCAGVFHHEVPTAKKPWTHLRFHNDPNAFQFAIVSDRTGGHREGVFPDALARLNQLRPEFVMCVGDLIEGYTDQREQLAREWRELDGFIAQLDMPFFYVPGNHDITNATMNRFWREKFGVSHYAFVYRDVLFMCLDTQDNGEYGGGMGHEQIAWAKRMLARHQSVRWTLVFMHQPLWVYDEHRKEHERDIPPTGFAAVQDALADRKYTVFAGHFHSYTKYQRRNRAYYILSTTGGVSDLRGSHFGEFDHAMWVTMTDDGPRPAILSIDGILPEDVYTERHRKFARWRREEQAEATDRMDLTLELKNPIDTAGVATVTWDIAPGSAWTVDPAAMHLQIAGDGQVTQDFQLRVAPEAPTIFPLPTCEVIFSADERLVAGRVLSLKMNMSAYLQGQRMQITAPRAAAAPTIDGKLDEALWQRKADFTQFVTAWTFQAPSQPTQGWLAYDDKHLYWAARSTEPLLDKLRTQVNERDGAVWHDDSVELMLDVDHDRKTFYQYIVNAAGTVMDGVVRNNEWNGPMTVKVGREDGAWTMEMAIPWSTFETDAPSAQTVMGVFMARTRTPGGGEILQCPATGTGNLAPQMYADLRFAP